MVNILLSDTRYAPMLLMHMSYLLPLNLTIRAFPTAAPRRERHYAAA